MHQSLSFGLLVFFLSFFLIFPHSCYSPAGTISFAQVRGTLYGVMSIYKPTGQPIAFEVRISVLPHSFFYLRSMIKEQSHCHCRVPLIHFFSV